MPEHNQEPDGVKKFHWSFSFGASPEDMQKAIEAARAAGVEPEIKVTKHVWKWNPLQPAEGFERPERPDPFQTLRRVMAWIPSLLFLALVAGGVLVGFFEPTLGPYWGGITGLIFGAFTYEMLRPRGWFK